ncbi:hypothetical protein L9F63_012891, partial [Diploptera punctata]
RPVAFTAGVAMMTLKKISGLMHAFMPLSFFLLILKCVIFCDGKQIKVAWK